MFYEDKNFSTIKRELDCGLWRLAWKGDCGRTTVNERWVSHVSWQARFVSTFNYKEKGSLKVEENGERNCTILFF